MTSRSDASAPCCWLAGALLAASGAAWRRRTKPAPAPAAPAPRPAAGAAAPAGPVKLDLHADAIAVDQDLRQGPGQRQGSLLHDARLRAGRRPAADAGVAIYQMQGEESRIARFLLAGRAVAPSGLSPDASTRASRSTASSRSVSPTAASPRPKLNSATIAALKKAQTAIVHVRNQGNVEVTLQPCR